MKLSIIIPTYNERKRLPPTLDAYFDFFDKKGLSYEIIIADISNDGTKEFVESYNHKNLIYYDVKERGKGLAVYKAFRKARGKIIGFTDADNAIPPEEFFKLVRLTNRFDGVIASRGLMREYAIDYHGSFTRRLFSLGLSLFFVKFLYGLRVNDSQCGAKVFKRDKLLKVLPKMKIMNSYFDIELVWRFSKVGKIKELPIKWYDKAGTHFTWKEPLQGTYWLIKTRIGL